jgi:hypothetical protein
LPYKKLTLYPEKTENPTSEPKVEHPEILRITQEKKEPVIVAQVSQDDPASGWKKILLDGDPITVLQATAANLNANVFTKHDNKTYKTAVFDSSSSGNLVAAVANKVIKLHAMTIQAQGTVVVNLNNGSGGASLMEWSFQAREGAVIPMANAPAYWAITSVNTALYVTLSAAVVVTITAIYSDDDTA